MPEQNHHEVNRIRNLLPPTAGGPVSHLLKVPLGERPNRTDLFTVYAACYFGPAKHWLVQQGADESDAQDLAVDLIYKTWIDLSGGVYQQREGTSYRAWFRTVMRHRLIDHWRRLGRDRDRASTDAGIENFPEHSGDPAAQAVLAEEQALFEEAERRVWPMLWEFVHDRFAEDREVVDLIFAKEKPGEIAERTGAPVARVYRVKSRLKTFVRNTLKRLGLGEEELPC